MRKLIHYSKGLAQMIWAKIRITFGHEYDSSVIPNGVYCYEPDYEKNTVLYKMMHGEETDEHWDGIYHIKPCPYFIVLNKRWSGCKYNGIITDDLVFNDQCKMCGKNKDYAIIDPIDEIGEI